MRNSIVSISLMLLVTCLIFGQAKQNTAPNVVQEITVLENEWSAAARKYDVPWFERNLADTYVETDENGAVINKSTKVANVKEKAMKYETASEEGMKVQPYGGDAAVATGISAVKGTLKGKAFSGKYAWTDVWVKIGGRWQCVAEHYSKLPSK